MNLRRGLIAAVVAAQITVPLIALLGNAPPTRLGFQMYSGLGRMDITVKDRHGAELQVNLNDILVVQPRAELDWTDRLPAALCKIPDAAQVTVTQSHASRTVRC